MSEGAPGETCADCPWFAEIDWVRSVCRRYPPQFVLHDGLLGNWEYPRVSDLTPSCGEHPRHPAKKA
jgi:hypothetical protein